MTLNDIKKELRTLSRGELVNLRNAVTVLLSMGGAGGDASTDPAESKADDIAFTICTLICDHMKATGTDFSSPHTLKTLPIYPAFRQKIVEDGVYEFLQSATKNNRVRAHALARTAIKLLHQNLVDMKVPVSARMMLQHAHRLPSVLDTAYPGYARNGVLHLVVEGD